MEYFVGINRTSPSSRGGKWARTNVISHKKTTTTTKQKQKNKNKNKTKRRKKESVNIKNAYIQ